jgi:multiple sugar transport system permease protein
VKSERYSSAVVLERSARGPRRKPSFRLPRRFLFVVPGFVMFTGLILIPLAMSIVYSMTNRNLIYPGQEFVGFKNYIDLLGDTRFQAILSFSVALAAVLLVIVNAIGLGIALLLNRMGWFFSFMRTVFFIPVALSGVIISFLWSTILADKGLLNTILREFGLENFTKDWLGIPSTAQLSVIVVSAWASLGLCVVVYLAGLQSVPRELIDAARIDGCGMFSAFRYVTWPSLAPSVTINSTLLLIIGLKSYDIPIVLTGTGPIDSTATIGTEVVRVGFSLNQVGAASALAVVMVMIIGAVSITIALLFQRREVSS